MSCDSALKYGYYKEHSTFKCSYYKEHTLVTFNHFYNWINSINA